MVSEFDCLDKIHNLFNIDADYGGLVNSISLIDIAEHIKKSKSRIAKTTESEEKLWNDNKKIDYDVKFENNDIKLINSNFNTAEDEYKEDIKQKFRKLLDDKILNYYYMIYLIPLDKFEENNIEIKNEMRPTVNKHIKEMEETLNTTEVYIKLLKGKIDYLKTKYDM